MAYYPDWVGSTFPPTRIDFKRVDWIDFAFAVPTEDFSLTWDDPTGPTLLEDLVSSAHSMGAKVKLSIGGWTGSKHFSSAVATPDSRVLFAQNILAVYLQYSLDGIEIDWEYPGQAGSPGNKFHPDDTANFLLFLNILRTVLPPVARITAAVEPTPFVDAAGRPLTDVEEFSKVLDWVLIMNYDIWGSSSHPGPNAPLYDACENSTQPDASAAGAYDAWTKANFPTSKLVLGLPSYGYISSSTEARLRTRSKTKAKKTKSGKIVGDDGDSEGQVQFNELVQQGVLLRSGNDSFHYEVNAESGFEGLWDGCSETPYLRSSIFNQVITYDNPTSLAMKAAFAKKVGMLGINLFDIHGDTDRWDLLDSIRYALELL
ncbi:Chitinase A1 [Psilocybe cubensis]|nr:Chitinase A1 [Psilocybe cubensis]KAH9482401.1 Chitinase A1 [Psilocybe cubensis]